MPFLNIKKAGMWTNILKTTPKSAEMISLTRNGELKEPIVLLPLITQDLKNMTSTKA